MSVVLAWGISAALAAPVTGAPATSAPASAPAPVFAPSPVQRPAGSTASATPAAGPTSTAPTSTAPTSTAPTSTAPAAGPSVVPVAVSPTPGTPAPGVRDSLIGQPGELTAVVPLSPTGTNGPTAAQLLNEGRLLEAALEYEDAWRSNGQPADLLGAAAAREAMYHYGHAASYLRELVARGHGDPAVTNKLAFLEKALVPVRIIVSAPEANSELVVLARYRGRAADARPDLVLKTTPTKGRTAEVQVPLDRGRWEVWVADEYYSESRQELTVTGGVAPVVQLEPVPRESSTEHARRMASPALLLGVGIGLLAGGQVATKKVLKRTDVECSMTGFPCRDLMARGVSLRSAGAGLLGASVGMAAAHLVQLSPKRRVRRVVWATEAGLGLVGVVAGSVGVALSARSYNSLDYGTLWSDEELQAALKRSTTGHTVAAFFLGMGAGMLVRSVGYLLDANRLVGRARRERKERKGPIAFSPSGGMTAIGGVLSAKF